MTKVFIDGSAGTTGLLLRELLHGRPDITFLTLPDECRKDASAKCEIAAAADIVFLCLPDEAARETAAVLPKSARIIDASSAHRTAPGWVYGFPELSARHRADIIGGTRVSVPGCHASGFIALTYPLIQAGILKKSARLACFSLTGYSGGGKAMIAEYEAENRLPEYAGPRIYALGQAHKHLPEMQYVTGLKSPPVFTPVIADVFSGMAVTVPLNVEINGTIDEVHAALSAAYDGAAAVTVMPKNTGIGENPAMLAMLSMHKRHGMKLFVSGGERLTLTAVYDNLYKGAAGAAVQCFNLMTGSNELDNLHE